MLLKSYRWIRHDLSLIMEAHPVKWDRAVEGNRRGGNNRRVQEEAAGGDKGRKEAGENSLSEYSRHADTMPNI